MPGVGVDGVRFGDTHEEIRERLGISQAEGSATGPYGSRLVYYATETSDGLSILLYPEEKDSKYDKDFFTADYFRAEAPYEGETPEGIGLGSEMEEVLRAYGQPVATQGDSTGFQSLVYCFGDKELSIGVEHGRVTMMGMGYHRPPPEPASFECRK